MPIKIMASAARVLAAGILAAALSACSGVGVVSSSSGLVKLEEARDLFQRQNRPAIAEKLTFEAMEIYRETNDDHGLGNAHRQYGEILISPAVKRRHESYKKDGFYDRSVTFANREEKALEYFRKAFSHYAKAEPTFRAEKQYDRLANLYLNMAFISWQTDNIPAACRYADQGMATTQSYYQANQNVKPASPVHDTPQKAFEQYNQIFEGYKKTMECDSAN